MKREIWIPERFSREIILHVAKNLLVDQFAGAVPLILGIHGTSGDGKTFQTEQILTELGVEKFLISGGQLESHQAGEPAQLIREAYTSASMYVKKHAGNISVVLINDIDTGVGNWGDMVQYTINRQTVFGELMHLVDYPTSVEGRSTKRIPIIITGNDFTKLYEPLVRAGRMTSFAWCPTIEEKAKIISAVFQELDDTECIKLVRHFENQPVAFFTYLRTTIIDDDLWNNLKHRGVSNTLREMAMGMNPTIKLNSNYHSLVALGETLLTRGSLINHLRNQTL